uniref:Endoxylanase-like protein n=1 Tax=Adineta vaga TaxID=104782 RepID=B3G448_ADIVA|nr:endoxylanase precursor-like protein [Adineta vaga]
MKSSFIFLNLILMINAFEPITFTLSPFGNQFQVAHTVELLTTSCNILTIIRCTTLCYRHIQCRTFDYDSTLKKCRLFEGSVDTGTLISAPSSTIVGWIILKQSLYNFYNATNNYCMNSRFLDNNIVSNLCQCPIHTFWNGSVCANQKYVGQGCVNDNCCRTDLNLTCISSICTGKNCSKNVHVPRCIQQSTTGGTLLYILNPTSTIYPLYTCYSYTWIATGASATLSFFFRHDPGGWMVDDITVYRGSTQLLVNGGFETGNLTGWIRTGTCNLNIGEAYFGNTYAKSGDWYYYDRCAGAGNGDTISQTFSTIPGEIYNITFWLANYDCCDETEIANITLI